MSAKNNEWQKGREKGDIWESKNKKQYESYKWKQGGMKG